MKPIIFYRIVPSLFIFLFVSNTWGQTQNARSPIAETVITLPALNYDYDELEPVISAQTLMLHYEKHLKGYIDNVNKLIKNDASRIGQDLEKIVKTSSGKLYNNSAQAWNHFFYFDSFAPQDKAQHKPYGALAREIDKQWGDFNQFKKSFVTVASELFGSGWVWLVKNRDGSLEIIGESNAGNILTRENVTPLLGIDVWEHAYYLDYQNRRPEHLNAIWNIINWKVIDARYNNAL
ncbi:superoxide dismutase [Coprobacter tertius]|uniref:Superoxide dismutase n=1 Tax=Coprobacter tertius TaxID=2944915 RepID=A0ABT1MMA5_9BACT|nr:superoxide dismutase [Coprobacter tertius]MCP9612878.1 superoxide dismutase [Coprobacter tertius]